MAFLAAILGSSRNRQPSPARSLGAAGAGGWVLGWQAQAPVPGAGLGPAASPHTTEGYICCFPDYVLLCLFLALWLNMMINLPDYSC